MHGHKLILPHHHHVHHRSADQQNNIPHKFAFESVLSENCAKSKMNVTMEKIEKALKVNNDTRNEIVEILEKWLNNKSRTRDSAVEEYVLHYLELEYPLHEEVKNKHYDAADTTLTETELQKILVSLNIIHHLTNHVIRNQSRSDYKNFLCYVPEKIQHNKVEVRDMLADGAGCELVPEYSYNTKHTNLVFAVLNETVTLLEVIEKKFHVMSEQLNRMHMG